MSAPVPSHWWPRTGAGRGAVIAFVALAALAQPPIVWMANRIQPALLGIPFLYLYLTVVYVAMMAVLLWARRRRL